MFAFQHRARARARARAREEEEEGILTFSLFFPLFERILYYLVQFATELLDERNENNLTER
jgi:hypothetical protein